MATISNITTGEQTVTETGAITGTLSTSSLTGDYTVKIRVRGLASGDTIQIALEDTANSSEFSDALQPWVVSIPGGMPVEGVTFSKKKADIPTARVGATHNEFRFNVQSISAGTAYIFGWLEA